MAGKGLLGNDSDVGCSPFLFERSRLELFFAHPPGLSNVTVVSGDIKRKSSISQQK